uniref:Uncharacterized protein n=1 Tax=Brassica campestris TaxID=3711 RepID=A0A3P6CPU0_BRACM|nr:unnamed protein product [Brassica rapa]
MFGIASTFVGLSEGTAKYSMKKGTKSVRPCCKAMTATKEFDNLDSIEEGEDAERELQEAERKHREEIEKLEKESS